MKKIFVLDTNVLLHDYECLNKFEDNDIVLPICVLEELDNFKKGHDLLNYQARHFVRVLEELIGDDLFGEGVSLGEGMGKLKVEIDTPRSELIAQAFSENSADHKILATAEHLCKSKTDSVILVTKDINLRLKAKALGIPSQDYRNDKVKDISLLEGAFSEIALSDNSIIDELYDKHEVSADKVPYDGVFESNQFVVLNGQSDALGIYNKGDNVIRLIETHTAYGIKPRNAEQKFCLDVLLNPEIKLVSISGKAGTGKTLLSLAAAISQHGRYDQILLARPTMALSNKDLGFLPGNIKEKMDPYIQPLFDNLGVIKKNFNLKSQEYAKIQELQDDDRLVITPLAYIRGRSLSNVYFIIDEAQNLSPHEVKTIITRAGENAKLVFTGDIHQIDSPYLDIESNGLSYLAERMKGQDLFAHVNLVKGERSELAELASNLL
ncbi:MAG: PhoH family protein [Bacteroidales bacterium]